MERKDLRRMNRDRQGTFSIQIDDRRQRGTLESCLGIYQLTVGLGERHGSSLGVGDDVVGGVGRKGRYGRKSLKRGRT